MQAFLGVVMAGQFDLVKVGIWLAAPRSAVEAGPAVHRLGEVVIYR